MPLDNEFTSVSVILLREKYIFKKIIIY